MKKGKMEKKLMENAITLLQGLERSLGRSNVGSEQLKLFVRRHSIRAWKTAVSCSTQLVDKLTYKPQGVTCLETYNSKEMKPFRLWF